MRRPGPLRLRTALVALVLVALLPLTGLSMRSAFEARDRARRQVVVEAERLARLAALRHSDVLESARLFLERIAATVPAGTDGSPCPPGLDDLAASEPRFTNVGMVDPAGALVCAAHMPEGPVNFADRDWFEQARTSGKFSLGRYVVGRITGLPALVFGLPVEGPAGGVEGVLWAALDLSWLQQFAASLAFPGRPSIILADEGGTVLARMPSEDGGPGNALPVELTPLLEGAVDGVEVDDGVRRYYAGVRLGGDAMGALIALGVPVTPVLDAAQTDVRRNLLGVLVALVLGVGGAWLVANRFVGRPARSLVGASRRLAAGDAGVRTEPGGWPREFAQVGQAFDDMAGALEARTTELEEAVEDQRRGEVRFRTLLEAAPDGIVGVDGEGAIRLVNRRAELMFRYRREDMLGRRVEMLADDPVFLRSLMARFASGRPKPVRDGARLELTARRGDGSTFPAEVVLAAFEAGSVVVSAAVRDVTERVEAQAAQASLEAQLQQAERLEGLGRLAGGVAHDFNNRLAVILNYADFIADSLPEDPPPGLADTVASIQDDLAAITRAGQAAAELTRQLLIFGRRDVGRPEDVDVNAAVRVLEPLLARTLGEDVQMHLALDPGVSSVRIDSGRLEQMLVSLAVNARDAMPGGGDLSITTKRLEVSAPEGGPGRVKGGVFTRVAVRDTGTGMTDEVAERAFEPFFTTKPRGEGTGLGLATLYGVVVEAGGRVGLETAPGKGTTVIIDLPAVTSIARPEPEHGAVGSQGEETVLVVEDEDPVREVARRILSEAGYVVMAVPGGEEALALLREDPEDVDLILSDVVMPGMAGPELGEHVRTVRPDLPVVYMSGYSEELLARRAGPGSEEVAEILRKPFTREMLLRRVREALDLANR